MDKLKLENFVEIIPIDKERVSMTYFETIENKSNSTISFNPITVEYSLNEDLVDEEKLIEKTIQSLLDNHVKSTLSSSQDIHQFDIGKKFFTKEFEYNKRLLGTTLHMLSNIIFNDTRVGPGNTIIIPEKFKDFFDFELSQYYLYYTPYLKYDIIVLRKHNNDHESRLSYIHNDKKGKLIMLNYSNYYKVLHTKTLYQDRMDKIKNLFN